MSHQWHTRSSSVLSNTTSSSSSSTPPPLPPVQHPIPNLPPTQPFQSIPTSVPTVKGRPRGIGKSKGRAATSGAGGGVDGKGKTRKKVAKACLTCQKSHLTCDELRPCTRCVKKGLGDQCVEGVRKKAKYLLDPVERGQTSQTSSSSPSTRPHPQTNNSSTTSLPTIFNPYPQLPPDQSFQPSLYPTQNDLLALASVGSTNSGVSSLSNVIPSVSPILQRDVWLAPPLEQAPMEGQIAQESMGVPSQQRFWEEGGIPFDVSQNTSFPFTSQAANMEYEMLDSMFGTLSPVFGTLEEYQNAEKNPNPTINDDDQIGYPPWTNDLALTGTSEGNQGIGGMISTNSDFQIPSNPNGNSNASGTVSNPWQGWSDDTINQVTQDQMSGQQPPPGPGPGQGQTLGSINTVIQSQVQSTVAPQPQISGFLSSGTGALTSRAGGRGMTPTEVYRTVLKPYDYTEGYHFLMQYLTQNFDQSDVLRVVRSLATFRPSLIALQMPMSEEDEVFLERSFQRTLIELEKLISYSSTPTAVWRRTGEICFADSEFCKLVGKSEEELLTKRTYICQLFAKSSVIAYWENFSVHAFENTTQNFFQSTTFELEGFGRLGKLNCSCCFTIRRDVFDLPSVVIGQFLPNPLV